MCEYGGSKNLSSPYHNNYNLLLILQCPFKFRIEVFGGYGQHSNVHL
jgi:hypothetical protein